MSNTVQASRGIKATEKVVTMYEKLDAKEEEPPAKTDDPEETIELPSIDENDMTEGDDSSYYMY